MAGRTLRRLQMTAISLLVGCSGTGDAGSAAALDAKVVRRRVLVTGFNDWKDLGDPPNIWRCEENPSCRLLTGEPSAQQPATHGGPLVKLLRASDAIEWEFATIPVAWGVFETIDTRDYDVVINMGLGVYDRFDRLQLEVGAHNRREGSDAAGAEVHEAIEMGAPPVKQANVASAVAGRLVALEGTRWGGFEVVTFAARPENSYLCNETHYRALLRLDESLRAGGRLQEVYFLHIPHARDGDYGALAAATAHLLRALVTARE